MVFDLPLLKVRFRAPLGNSHLILVLLLLQKNDLRRRIFPHFYAGTSPLLQFNTPYNYMQTQSVNELAENVVSTVKSGLFRAATGLLWGGGGAAEESAGGQALFMTEEQRRRRDPEQRLTTTQAFKDHLKAALQMEKSPSGLHVAVVDNQNRVAIQ